MAQETDYAWAAGIVDGEGSIAMTRNKPGMNRRATLSFQVRVTVVMTHEPTIRRLYDIFGGTVGIVKPRDPTRHRQTYRWYVGDIKTVECLTRMLPYMTTKRQQAELVLEYRARCFTDKPTGRGATCDPGVVQLRNHYFEELARTNQRGVLTKLGY